MVGIKQIYGNWDPLEEQAFEKKNDLFSIKSSTSHAHLALPISLFLKNADKKKSSSLVMGCNAVWSAAPESYMESLGSLMTSKMHIPFILIDFGLWELYFPDTLKEVRLFSQRLINQKTPVVIRWKNSLAAFLNETLEKQWVDQSRFLLEGLNPDSWEYLSLSFCHPHHNYYESHAFIEKMNDSYQKIREGLTAQLGQDMSRIRLLTELPLESAQRKLLIQETNFDGLYFPNVSLYPDLFLETCIESARK